ncbi:MAG: hypothetical protein ACK5O3_08215 [Burkholderiales bacterium]
MHSMFPRGLLLGLLAPLAVWAQTHRDSPRDALDRQAPVPPTQHCSVLRATPAASEPQAQDWRQANARVHEAGGWRQYAKEAAREADRPSPPPCNRPLEKAK